MLIVYLLILIVVFLIGLWVIAFWVSNDFSIPATRQFPYQRVLVIFPHPDDEVLTTGGLLREFSSQGVLAKLLVLSQGEKGTPDASFNPKLGKIRVSEMKHVAEILDVHELCIDNFPDGDLRQHYQDVQARIIDLLDEFNPELVITYDLSGMYGHDDHIVVSEIVTSLINKQYPDTNLWYATLPSKVYKRLGLPTHMAQDDTFLTKRTTPTHKVWVGRHIFNKVRAVYAHKSQYLSFRNSIPVNVLPIGFFLSTGLFEYFHEVSQTVEAQD